MKSKFVFSNPSNPGTKNDFKSEFESFQILLGSLIGWNVLKWIANVFLVIQAIQKPKNDFKSEFESFQILFGSLFGWNVLKRIANVFLIIQAIQEPKMTLNLDLNHFVYCLAPCSAETH
jgi:hypothetical protein